MKQRGKAYHPVDAANLCITFNCPSCAKEFKVDASKAGQRGKCPACSSVFTVPVRTQDVPIFDEELIRVKDDRLNRLYRAVVEEVGEALLGEQILGENLVRLDVLVDGSGRHQNVVIALLDGGDTGRDQLLLVSSIGTLEDAESAVVVLRMLSLQPRINLYLAEDAVLYARYMQPIDNVDTDEFVLILAQLAQFADHVEETLFGYDGQ